MGKRERDEGGQMKKKHTSDKDAGELFDEKPVTLLTNSFIRKRVLSSSSIIRQFIGTACPV